MFSLGCVINFYSFYIQTNFRDFVRVKVSGLGKWTINSVFHLYVIKIVGIFWDKNVYRKLRHTQKNSQFNGWIRMINKQSTYFIWQIPNEIMNKSQNYKQSDSGI